MKQGIKLYFLIQIVLTLLVTNTQSKIYLVSSEFPVTMTTVPTNTGWSNTENAQLYSCVHGKVYTIYNKSQMSKTFNDLPPHYSLALNLEFWPFSTWDPNEHVILKIDSQEIYKQEINTGPSGVLQDMYIFNDSYCNSIGLGSQFLLGHNTTHTASSVTITLDSQLSSPGADESFGISRFMLNVDECHFTCLSCTGPSEDNCDSCPPNSTKTGNTCLCDTNFTSQNHECIATCPNGYTLDSDKRICVQQCPINNCDTCNSSYQCTTCSSGYKLMKGKCYDQCPWFAPENSGNCVDSGYNAVPRPYTVLDDMINKDFSHSELQANGWSYIKTLDYNGKSVSSLSGHTCAGETFAMGFNFMPTNVTCSDGCGIQNTFNNLPAHYKASVKYLIQCGDTWDTPDSYKLNIDGTQEQIINFTQGYGQSNKKTCGRNRGDIDNLLNIFTHTVSIDHFSNSLDVQFRHNLDQMSWDEWAGYREISVYLNLCDNYRCKSCSGAGQDCIDCLGSTGQTSSRILSNYCKCPVKFYDDLVNDECQECIKECASCSSGTTCDTCIGTSSQTFSRDSSNQCKCPAKHHDNNNSDTDCSECLPQCASCSMDDQCDTCLGSTGQDSSRDSANKCSCPNKFYDDYQNFDECQSCLQECATCSSGTACDSCIGTQGQTFSRLKTENCKCPTKYHDNNKSLTDCISCLYGCATCSDDSSCDTCIGSTLQNSSRDQTNQCKCPLKYHDSNETLIECSECLPQCASCSDEESCDTCIGSSGQLSSRNQLDKCKCPDGYFDDYQNFDECQQCNMSKCSTCEQNRDNCIICSDETRGGADCQCITHYFEIQGQASCEKCDDICNECSVASDSCTDCALNSNRDIDNSCLCLVNYFQKDEDIECQKCDDKCQGCTINSGNCTECKGQNTETSDCIAKSGYYLEENSFDAIKCNKNCATCNEKNLCLTCNNGQTAPYCIQVSEQSFVVFLPDGEMVVNKCNDKCKSCQGSVNNCQECSDPSLTVENNCESQNQYVNCPSGCKSCDSLGLCLDCDKTQYYSENTKQCEKCYFFQGSCVSQCPQFTDQDESNFECKSQSGMNSTVIILLIILAFVFILGIVGIVVFTNKNVKKPYNKQQFSKMNQQSSNDIENSAIKSVIM